MRHIAGRVGIGIMTAAVMTGCGKPPTPKVEAEQERADATARAKQRAYAGDAVKAHEMAKGLGADLNKKAQDGVEKAEK